MGMQLTLLAFCIRWSCRVNDAKKANCLITAYSVCQIIYAIRCMRAWSLRYDVSICAWFAFLCYLRQKTFIVLAAFLTAATPMQTHNLQWNEQEQGQANHWCTNMLRHKQSRQRQPMLQRQHFGLHPHAIRQTTGLPREQRFCKFNLSVSALPESSIIAKGSSSNLCHGR